MRNKYFLFSVAKLICYAAIDCLNQILRLKRGSIIKHGVHKISDAEAPILWSPGSKSQLIRKDPNDRKDWRQKEKGEREDEMVGCHHQLNGHESEQAPGGGRGQETLVCCSSGVTKSQTQLSNWTIIRRRNLKIKSKELKWLGNSNSEEKSEGRSLAEIPVSSQKGMKKTGKESNCKNFLNF